MQKTVTIAALLLLGCLSCRKAETATPEGTIMAFSETRWHVKKGKDYPYRDAMLDDLISSDTIKKLNKGQTLHLLGNPERAENNHLFYLITQKRIQSWPLHTKTLVIKFKPDETVEWVKIHE